MELGLTSELTIKDLRSGPCTTTEIDKEIDRYLHLQLFLFHTSKHTKSNYKPFHQDVVIMWLQTLVLRADIQCGIT